MKKLFLSVHIDMMDVSAFFKDGPINSIEKKAHGVAELMVGDKPGQKSAVMSEVYQYIRPELDSGVSGAPIFRVKQGHKSTVEFMGVQAFSSKDGTHGLVVKEADMFRMLNHLK